MFAGSDVSDDCKFDELGCDVSASLTILTDCCRVRGEVPRFWWLCDAQGLLFGYTLSA